MPIVKKVIKKKPLSKALSKPAPKVRLPKAHERTLTAGGWKKLIKEEYEEVKAKKKKK